MEKRLIVTRIILYVILVGGTYFFGFISGSNYQESQRWSRIKEKYNLHSGKTLSVGGDMNFNIFSDSLDVEYDVYTTEDFTDILVRVKNDTTKK